MKKIQWAFTAILLSLMALPVQAQEQIYELKYFVRVAPDEAIAEVRMELAQSGNLLREVRFRADPGRFSEFDGDGTITVEESSVTWIPPEDGGEIRWNAVLESTRSNGAYDGMVTPDWAVFRADDLVPPAYTRSLKGASSRARLALELPAGWSAVTPFEKLENGDFLVVNPDRNFDRPTGWLALGELGVRRDTIADIRVTVAGPKDQGLRRQDILAFLNWTLPTLRDIFPGMSDRLLIVGANDPMWRGGLSGPSSLYIHADRPLISENGTSTLLHELVHVATSLRAKDGADWIVEGVAEYYALQILLRSGTISDSRYRKSFESLKSWAGEPDSLASERSTGKITAGAVVVLDRVDQKIRSGSGNRHSLDDVVRIMAEEGTVSSARFFEIGVDMAGKTSEETD